MHAVVQLFITPNDRAFTV